MDALCKCTFIIFETIVNSMKTLHFHMKKEIQGSHYFSFFALSNLLTQTNLGQDRPAHFFWTIFFYIAYIVYYYISLPLCANILYFDAAKILNKTVLIYIFYMFLLSDNGMNMKKWLKRDPLRLHK